MTSSDATGHEIGCMHAKVSIVLLESRSKQPGSRLLHLFRRTFASSPPPSDLPVGLSRRQRLKHHRSDMTVLRDAGWSPRKVVHVAPTHSSSAAAGAHPATSARCSPEKGPQCSTTQGPLRLEGNAWSSCTIACRCNCVGVNTTAMAGTAWLSRHGVCCRLSIPTISSWWSRC
jgi:hypothetical protein